MVPVPGSKRMAMRGAEDLGPARPDEQLDVTVRLRRSAELDPKALDGTRLPKDRQYLSREELEKNHGAADADVAKVEQFAKQSGLSVTRSSSGERSVHLHGTVQQFEKAFGVKLEKYRHPKEGEYRGRVGEVQVPESLANVVVGVFGLDNRPFAHPRINYRNVSAAAAVFNGYPPPQIAQLYKFPTGLDGTGETIGIIELGGGFRPEDLKTYFQKINVPMPNVTAVSVDNGQNAPSTANSADGEVMLDIEVVASIAPKANIVVYFTPDASDQSFLDAITFAVHDSANKPSVISISWGGPESTATDSFQTEFDQVLQSAAAVGITVTIASGDNGAADEGPNEWDGQLHADFPASSPYALACGGTNITVAGGSISSETVWNQQAADTQNDSFGASGGGVSQVFKPPSYQQNANVPMNPAGKPGRGVPDVAGDGDPASGYLVRVDGQEFPVGGTSAVAPLWAGLIALCNQKLGKSAGFINPILYANPGACNDITTGNNRVGNQNAGYDAGPGWDACTGLGSPNGQKILAALGG